MKVDATRCPACDAPPTSLTVNVTLVAKPIGSFSLAGAQYKVSAYFAPVLSCRNCGLHVVGDWDEDGRHVTFPRPDVASSSQV